MMNEKALEKRINRNFERAKRDLTALRDDAIIELSQKIEHMAVGPRKTAVDAVKTVNKSMKTMNKSIGQGLNLYNARVQEAVDRVPGDLSKKVTGYPWVAITASLVVGLLLGSLVNFSRHSIMK